MSDDKTDTVEWLSLLLLFGIGVFFLARPAALTLGLFIDFLDAFPDPATLGPFGSALAVLSLGLGSGGMLRKRFKK